MIGYIKSTGDDVWMTLALSVRKEHVKTTANNVHIIRIFSDNMQMTSTYVNNSSRNEMYITYAPVDNIQMT